MCSTYMLHLGSSLQLQEHSQVLLLLCCWHQLQQPAGPALLPVAGLTRSGQWSKTTPCERFHQQLVLLQPQLMLRLLVNLILASNTFKSTSNAMKEQYTNTKPRTGKQEGYGTFAPPFATVTSHAALVSPRQYLVRSIL
jgi:hypothetical protein